MWSAACGSERGRHSSHEELKPKKSEYDKLHKDLQVLFTDKPQTTIGSFIVTPKFTEKRGSIKVSTLPADVQKSLEKYREPGRKEWTFKVDDISKKPEAEDKDE